MLRRLRRELTDAQRPQSHVPTAPPARASVGVNGLTTWLTTLDRMPAIRLPIGPAIRWR